MIFWIAAGVIAYFIFAFILGSALGRHFARRSW